MQVYVIYAPEKFSDGEEVLKAFKSSGSESIANNISTYFEQPYSHDCGKNWLILFLGTFSLSGAYMSFNTVRCFGKVILNKEDFIFLCKNARKNWDILKVITKKSVQEFIKEYKLIPYLEGDH